MRRGDTGYLFGEGDCLAFPVGTTESAHVQIDHHSRVGKWGIRHPPTIVTMNYPRRAPTTTAVGGGAPNSRGDHKFIDAPLDPLQNQAVQVRAQQALHGHNAQ